MVVSFERVDVACTIDPRDIDTVPRNPSRLRSKVTCRRMSGTERFREGARSSRRSFEKRVRNGSIFVLNPSFVLYVAGMPRVVSNEVDPTTEKQVQDHGRKGMLAKDRECLRAQKTNKTNKKHEIEERKRGVENELTHLCSLCLCSSSDDVWLWRFKGS